MQGTTGDTRIEVARNAIWIGALLLQDTVRPDASDALAAFAEKKLTLRMVTGDSFDAACRVSSAVGLPRAQVLAACSPEHKVDILEAAGRPAVFVGDGINDSLALAGADCGISLQGATPAAVAAAGVVIASGGCIRCLPPGAMRTARSASCARTWCFRWPTTCSCWGCRPQARCRLWQRHSPCLAAA
ncbi:HAD-IC family P-type ATPase [Massilia sp. Dwa41.01b]|uniref:HAD-IC family P-type ATPase n=1 Tax=unclassified Massilia TaxID=2609279 RepID=UPI0016021C1E|nr:HAD-IC family P-type ATPase [Massilia sp. Dwa41.01b]QNA99605.1 HAD-IC family P-type ATPase [Massilia sp. Se16.2.3]